MTSLNDHTDVGLAEDLDVDRFRQDFPTITEDQIYLDTVATSLTPIPVIDAMTDYYMHHRANVNRGVYDLSLQANARYEAALSNIAQHIGAKVQELAITTNTTHALSEVALTLDFKEGDEVLISSLEHSSNVLPWMRLAKTVGVKVKTYNPGKTGLFDVDEFGKFLSDKTRLVSLTHVSNVLGSVVPVEDVGRLCKERGVLFMIDGAQAVPHMPIDVKRLGCDFLAFSGHKMLGPTGIGVLYLRQELAESLMPAILGGGSVDTTACHGVAAGDNRIDDCSWSALPHKWMAGTPPIAEIIGLSQAVDYLNMVGIERIQAHDARLVERAMAGLAEIPGVDIFGPPEPHLRRAIVSFNLGNLPAFEVGRMLNEEFGIAVRAGEHCAVGYFMGAEQANPHLGNVRASFYFYNTVEEVDRFLAAVETIASTCL